MNPLAKESTTVLAPASPAAPGLAVAPPATPPPPSIMTPDMVESRIGTLQFKDGMPAQDTLDKVYDNLDFTHAFESFVNTMQGVNFQAIHKGLLDAGVKDNEVILFSELMDAKTVMLVANSDTVYDFGFLDLTEGPVVLEAPPRLLGFINDGWFRWVTDIGVSGPDRGLGGKYLILPPGYDGPLPEGGFHIARSETMHVLWWGRMFLENNDPKPAVEQIRTFTKIYPYQASGVGTSYAAFLSGKARLGPIAPPPETVFHEGSGKVMNTIAPNDFSYYEMLDEVVQQEPAASLDPELMGAIAAIGIVKGQPFAPDARMKKILTEAVEVANATSRSLATCPRDPCWYYYPGSAWWNSFFIGGYNFETPIPEIEGPVQGGLRTPEGVRSFPPTGYRTLDIRTGYFYTSFGVTPVMATRLSGIGSQYLVAALDADKRYFDGAKTYRVTLPKGIPAAKFWSLTVYDNQTRSMLQTPQRYPRGKPELSVARRRAQRRRLYDGVLRCGAAGRGGVRELDPDSPRQRLVCDAAPLRPARAVLRQDLAARGNRHGRVRQSTSKGRLTSGGSRRRWRPRSLHDWCLSPGPVPAVWVDLDAVQPRRSDQWHRERPRMPAPYGRPAGRPYHPPRTVPTLQQLCTPHPLYPDTIDTIETLDTVPTGSRISSHSPASGPRASPTSSATGPASSSHIARFSPQRCAASPSASGINDPTIPDTFLTASAVPLRPGSAA